MLPYSGKEEPVLPAPMTLPPPTTHPQAGAWDVELPLLRGDPVLSMQLSVFYKLESLLCCTPFLNWRLRVPSGLWVPLLWAGALGQIGKSWGSWPQALCSWLAPVPLLEQRRRQTIRWGHLSRLATLSGASAEPGSCIRLSAGCDLLGQSSTW